MRLAVHDPGHLALRRGIRAAIALPLALALSLYVVDDTQGVTLAYASTMEADLRGASADKTAKARKVGELVAERAKKAGIDAVVFDRGGNKYHGRVAALAEGAREGGLAF